MITCGCEEDTGPVITGDSFCGGNRLFNISSGDWSIVTPCSCKCIIDADKSGVMSPGSICI